MNEKIDKKVLYKGEEWWYREDLHWQNGAVGAGIYRQPNKNSKMVEFKKEGISFQKQELTFI